MGQRTLKVFGLKVFELSDERSAHPDTAESRATNIPAGTLSNPNSDVWQSILGSASSGTTVNENTALTYAPFWSAVRIISEGLATLPIKPYQIIAGSKQVAYNTPAYYLLGTRPNPFMSPFVWKDIMAATVLLWGNSFSYIRRTAGAKPYELEYIHPTKCDVLEDKENRALFYYLRDYGITVPATDMIHLRGFGDDKVGKSVLRYQMDTLGLGMAATDSSAEFFKNGAMVSGVLSSEGNVTAEQRKANKDAWNAAHAGTGNRMGTAVLGGGMKYQRIGIPPNEAQFLETQKYSAVQVASIFKIPAFMLQAEENRFKDVEELSNWFYTNTLLPWIIRVEEELNYKIFTIEQRNSGNFYTKFNANALLRANTTARAQYYKDMFGVGAYSINEIRDLEDRNPIADGDEHYVPANNMTPITLQKEHIQAKIESLKPVQNAN